ncbi:transposase [Saccharopolyspora spinosa]|uniref:Transposase n=1 Tax=Saccharopolyspora spinosa TaxID=60894 RepID=A0A2N3Y1A8_SACSN|nr:transposase [Saccharopolyspora spinosa]PKW16699.1 transposase [Saccharopolyspora spinosa]
MLLLAVGIDWAESFHDVALGRPGEGVIEQFRIDRTAAGVARLVARCLDREPDPAEVRVVLETRHGVLVETLVDAGFTLLPVNPDLVVRRRGGRRRKTTPKMPASAACWRWISSWTCVNSSRTGIWPVNCAPSPATTNAPPATSAVCSTGCAPICWRRSRPR